MLLPTRKLLLLLLLPAVVMLIWRGTGGLVLGLSLDAAVVGLVLFDLALSPRLRGIQVDRVLPPFLSLAADNAVGWDVRNTSRAPVRFSLKDDVPDSISRAKESVAGLLRARSHAELRYDVRPKSRGLHEFGDIWLRCETLLGLLVRQRRIPARTAVKVYPNVVNLARYELALRRHRTAELGLRGIRERGQGQQFESLRDYVVGDDWGDIAWKASARRGRLIIRDYEAERNQSVLLVLDCGRLMTTEFEGVARLDYAINAALLLTYVAMKQGDSIGLLAFDEQIQSYVPPVRGKGALARLNEAMYQLEPTLTEPNYDRACRFLALRYRKRSLIVIFTDVIDPSASAMLLAHAARFARQHLPLCVVFRDLETEALARARPEDSVDCFTKTVALQSLDRRAAALAQMRRHGVDVLECTPKELTPSLISRYLSLKQSRRL
jgi:uncharacterized protein (DUF58 family)